jgi:bacterioferritin-associated ferredoxin
VGEVQRQCGAGSDCGSCVFQLRKIVEERAAAPSPGTGDERAA